MAPYDRNSGSNKTGQAALPHKNIHFDKLLEGKEYSKEAMAVVRDKYLYNVSKSGPIGADYLIG